MKLKLRRDRQLTLGTIIGSFLRTSAVRMLLLAVALVLLWLAFRNTPLAEIVRAVGRIRPWQLGVILSINILFHVLTGTRWWLLARADLPQVRLADLIVVRMGAFGFSYFTPGPQLGGEPLQILFLRRKYSATFARAGATVMMDRLVELLAGIIVLPVGLIALIREGLFRNASSLSPAILLALALVAAWPAAHIALLWRGAHPVSSLLAVFRPPAGLKKGWRLIRASEHLAGRFCRRRPGAVLAGLLVTLLGASLAVMEYALITSFLDMRLSPWRIMAGWTSGWLSFLFPAPGALGALEGSQVVALGAFGVSNATALGAALVLRGRDLLFASTGLLLAARQLETSRAVPSPVRMAR